MEKATFSKSFRTESVFFATLRALPVPEPAASALPGSR